MAASTNGVKIIYGSFTGSHDDSAVGSFAKEMKTFLDTVSGSFGTTNNGMDKMNIQYLNPYPGTIAAIIITSGSLPS
jgi:hypothetical protein